MKIIKNKKDYDKAIKRIEELIDKNPDNNSKLGDELEVLSLLIEKYEDKYYQISLPDPIEAIKFRMEQQGLKYSDMVEYIGSRSKVSEVMNYKRTLSLNMIKRLHEGLGISADVLISDATKNIPMAQV